jgi:hypothetical protein
MIKALPSLLLLLTLSGCGYHLQNSENALLEKEQIRRVYVAPIRNNTYQAGVENVVYNALIKKISSQDQVILVRSQESADAVLTGSVDTAEYTISAQTTASQLPPKKTGPDNILVATHYNAVLGCNFELKRVKGTQKVWNSQFSRSKVFLGNNQLGALGTTSAIINDSEFSRALQDLSESIMADVHESMLELF